MFISKSSLPFSYFKPVFRSVFVASLKLSHFSPQILASAWTQHFCRKRLGIRYSERHTFREPCGRQKRACRLNMTRWMPCRAQGRFESFANYSIKKRVTRSSEVGVSKLRQFNDFELNGTGRYFPQWKKFLDAVIISEISMKKIVNVIMCEIFRARPSDVYL